MYLFEEHKKEFYEQIKKEYQNIPSNYEGYILKGDVSGIQDFIFNIKSRGAAKTLKSRSFFVQVMTMICLEKIKKELGLTGEQIELHGGGVFFLFIPNDKFDTSTWKKKIVKKVQEELKHEEISLVLAYEKVEEADNIAEKIDFINSKKLNRSRYRKNDLLENDIFEPYSHNDILHFEQKTIKAFTKNLSDAKSYTFIKEKPSTVKCFEKKQVTLFEYTYQLNNFDGKNSFIERAINTLPQWENRLKSAFSELVEQVLKERQEDEKEELQEDINEGNIIDFDFIAKMAKERTGTEKLAILKLDIDNLGTAFQGKDLRKIKLLSSSLNWFFDDFLLVLLNKHFKRQTREEEKMEIDLSYKDVIYNIYAGGDDCFLVGAWDAIFEFTQLLQTEFTAFAHYLTEHEDLKLEKKLTISAGIVVVHAKFPVIRFAELAEEALSEAKKHKVGTLEKNAISVFGEVISWDEFEKVVAIKNELLKLAQAEKDTNSIRSLLERVKNSIIGYESLQEKIKNGKISIQSVWRFNYYLRNIKSQKGKQIIDREKDKNDNRDRGGLVQLYQFYLIQAISGRPTNAAIFPIAARWTEFLTRKKL